MIQFQIAVLKNQSKLVRILIQLKTLVAKLKSVTYEGSKKRGGRGNPTKIQDFEVKKHGVGSGYNPTGYDQNRCGGVHRSN